MRKRLSKKLHLNRETLHYLDRLDLKEALGGLTTTPVGTCTENEPCMSTVRFDRFEN